MPRHLPIRYCLVLKAQGGSPELSRIASDIDRLEGAGALTDLGKLARIDFKSDGLNTVVADVLSGLVKEASSAESVEVLAKGLSALTANSNFSNEARRGAARALTDLAQASEGYKGGLGSMATALSSCMDSAVIDEIQREELAQGLFSVINNVGHDVDDLRDMLKAIASVGSRTDLPVVDILTPLLNKTVHLEAKADVCGASCDLFNAMVSLYGNPRLVDRLDELAQVMVRVYKGIEPDTLTGEEKLKWAFAQIGILGSSNNLPEGIDRALAASTLADISSDSTGIMKNQLGVLHQVIELYNNSKLEAYREQLEIAIAYLYLGLDQDLMDPQQKAEWVALQVRIATSGDCPEGLEKMSAAQIVTLIGDNVEGVSGLSQRENTLCATFLVNYLLAHPEGDEGKTVAQVLLKLAQQSDLKAGFYEGCLKRLSSKLDEYVDVGWTLVELRGNETTRATLVQALLGLSLAFEDDLPASLQNVFSFRDFSSRSPNRGEAGTMAIALESLPEILMEYAKDASRDAEIVPIVNGVKAILGSKFSEITLEHKTDFMRVLIELMPKVDTPETRQLILDALETQMHASTLYRLGKGIGEGIQAFASAITSTSSEHLFQGEVDDYVGKDLAAVLLNMEPEKLELWIDSGGEYYVGLALENVADYLESLAFETPEERNKLEARYVSFANEILNDFEGRSGTLRSAASVALNAIAQSTTDGAVMHGRAYLDALEG